MRRGLAVLSIFAALAFAQAQILMPILHGNAAGGGGSEPTFTHIQGKFANPVNSGTTAAVTLDSTPTAGNAVVCRIYEEQASESITSVVDNAGSPNTYTATTNSPSTGGVSGRIWIYYLLNVPASPGATITATFGSTLTAYASIACEEFHRSAGTWTFDTDATAGTGTPGATVNTPSITPSVSGEMLYGAAMISGGGAFFLNTAAQSPWTNDAGPDGSQGRVNGDYILNASGSNAQNMNITSGTAGWNSISMALK